VKLLAVYGSVCTYNTTIPQVSSYIHRGSLYARVQIVYRTDGTAKND